MGGEDDRSEPRSRRAAEPIDQASESREWPRRIFSTYEKYK